MNEELIKKIAFSGIYRSEILSQIPPDTTVIVIVGYADGQLVGELQRRMRKDDSLIIWEPRKDIFEYACSLSDQSAVITDDRISVILGNTEEAEVELSQVLNRTLTFYNIGNGVFLKMPGFEKDYAREFEILQSVVQKKRMEIDAGFSASIANKGLLCENMLYAVSNLQGNCLFDDFIEQIPTRDIPIIIVAAGPSLSRNAAQLKKAKNKAIIVAVAHAAKVLHNAGVKPDLLAVSDESNEQDYLDFDTEEAPFVIITAAGSRQIQEKNNGKLIYHGFENSLFPTLSDRQSIDATLRFGSVSGDVLALFVAAGFHTFILAGQDLAYGSDGCTHAGGEMMADENDLLASEIEGIDGKPVLSRPDWIIMLDFFTQLISLCPDIKVVDATEGGAKIRGTEILSLEESITKYCETEYRVDDWIKISEALYTDAGEPELMKDRYRNKTKTVYEKLIKAIQLNQSVQDDLKKAKQDESLISLYESAFNEILSSEDANLVFFYKEGAVNQYVLQAQTIGKTDLTALLKNDAIFLQELKDGCEKLLGLI